MMINVQRLPFFFSIFKSVCLFYSLLSSSYAYQFNVGGKYGWVTNPSENYNLWAGRMRFQVNDTLFFKYQKSDSALLVSKEDYKKCNTKKPIMKMDDGNSIFKFDRSGPFYFISGIQQSCQQGEKIIIVVLAVRNINHDQNTPPKAHSPSGHPPPASSPVGSHPPPTASAPPNKSPVSSPQASHHSPANAPTPQLYPDSQPPVTALAPGSGPVWSPVGSPAPTAGSHKASSPSPTSTTTAPPTSSATPEASTPPSLTGAGTSDGQSPAGSPTKSKAVSAFNPILIMLVTAFSVLLTRVLL